MDSEKIKKLAIVLGAIAIFMTILLVILPLFLRKRTQGPVTLVYWGLWEPAEVMEPLIKEYESSHPGIKINYVQKRFGNKDSLSYVGTYQDEVADRLVKTGGVDIVRIHYSWVAKYIKYLAPAPSKLLNANYMQEKFYPACYQAVVASDGNVYAMPLYIDGLVLFYNKQLLNKAGYNSPPETWEDLLGYAKTLTKKDSNGNIVQAGIAMGTASNVLHAPEIILLMLSQSGVNIVDLNARSFNLTGENAVSALDFYLNFAREGVWDYRLPSDLNMFAQGKLAMMIAPSWRAHDIGAMNSKLEYGIAPVPVLAGIDPSVPKYVANFWVEAVPRNSKHKKEAWEFLYWLSQPEQLRKLYDLESKLRAFGEPYSLKSMASELKGAPYVSAVIEMAPYMKSWPLVDYGVWEEQFKTQIASLEGSKLNAATILSSVNTNLNKLIFNK